MLKTIKTAQDWRDYIAQGRDKQSRPIDNNTTVRLIDGGVAIRLHATDVVTLRDDGRAVLSSGGWATVTTKDRINKYAPASVYSRAGVWYIDDRDDTPTLFYDGMTVDRTGYPLKPRKTARYEKRLTALKKQARTYAKAYVAELQAGQIAYPSSGDCWGCAFATKEHTEPMGVDHLRQHIKERYYVPSLLVNAAHEAGYRDMQIGLMGIGGQSVFIEPERIIYKYMVKHLQKEA